MKAQNGYVVLSMVMGVIFMLYFSTILQTVPELSGQSPAENKTGDKIIMHTHSSLNVTVNGNFLLIPNVVRINSTLWNEHSLDRFGTERKSTTFGMITPAMSPLHAHDSSGLIHVESTEYRNYTLGDFLNIWGLPLEGRKVNLITDGNSPENYANHILKDMEKMILKIED